MDRSLVLREGNSLPGGGAKLLCREGVPDSHRAVLAGRGHLLSVARQGGRPDRTDVTSKRPRDERVPAPKPRRTVVRSGQQRLAVGCEGGLHDTGVMAMLLGGRTQFAGFAVPNDQWPRALA